MMQTELLQALARPTFELARGIIERGESLSPLILHLFADNTGVLGIAVMDATPFMQSEGGKRALAASIPDLLAAPETAAIVLVVESWLSTRTDILPSEDPERKEAVVVTLMAFGKSPARFGFEILRNPDRLVWREPDPATATDGWSRFCQTDEPLH